jgi:hypothetical protein
MSEEMRLMREGIVWILAVVALPGIAAANGVQPGAVIGSLADNASAGVEAAAAPSGLDLQIDALPVPAPGASNDARAIAPTRPERYSGAEPQAAERGLSFGLELRRRNAADNLARAGEPDESGLQDDLERLIDRSALGLRGKYRF